MDQVIPLITDKASRIILAVLHEFEADRAEGVEVVEFLGVWLGN